MVQMHCPWLQRETTVTLKCLWWLLQWKIDMYTVAVNWVQYWTHESLIVVPVLMLSDWLASTVQRIPSECLQLVTNLDSALYWCHCWPHDVWQYLEGLALLGSVREKKSNKMFIYKCTDTTIRTEWKCFWPKIVIILTHNWASYRPPCYTLAPLVVIKGLTYNIA